MSRRRAVKCKRIGAENKYMDLNRRCLFQYGFPWWGMVSSTLASSGDKDRKRPLNLFLISIDGIGCHDLSCYGSKESSTPAIDRLASGGMHFTDHYAGSPLSGISQFCLMTGHTARQATTETQKRAGKDGPSATIPFSTVAGTLKKAGYSTGAVGLWDMGTMDPKYHPMQNGFDSWYGWLGPWNSRQPHPPYILHGKERMDIKENQTTTDRRSTPRNPHRMFAEGEDTAIAPKPQEVSPKRHAQDLFTAEAISFLQNHGSRPFFLYLSYPTPHDSSSSMPRLDSCIGRLLDLLRELDLENSTQVFLTGIAAAGNISVESRKTMSDPSLRYQEYYRLAESHLRVPLVVRWPGKIRPGSVSSQPCALWDFRPTVAESTGLLGKEKFDGISYIPALLGRRQKTHEYLYWKSTDPGAEAVRFGTWKVIRRRQSDPLELYDLSRDREETDDLALKHPDLVRRAEKYLSAAQTGKK